jgi:hypothetical protein
MAYTTINKSTDNFNTKLYTGDGNSSQSITGVGFQPDLVWLKNRSAAAGNHLSDAVRGKSGSNYYTLVTDTNAAQAVQSDYDGVNTLGTDGFTVGYSNSTAWNNNADNYVAWNWLAGGTASSNTDGSITSSVSANTTAGFSIVSYTGTGSQATVGHGLGATPKWIVVKRLQNTEDWAVYHASNGAGTYQSLNTTEAKNTNSNRFNVAPTSSVFTVNTHESVNYAENYIAYCFAEKTGYSKFGSYTGNGNADGTFVYTGFKPAFVIFKRSSGGTGNWQLLDNKRLGYNVENRTIYPNSNIAEQDEDDADILSNGFKLRGSGTDGNGSGSTYIYMAFGQSIVGSNNIPATAR